MLVKTLKWHHCHSQKYDVYIAKYKKVILEISKQRDEYLVHIPGKSESQQTAKDLRSAKNKGLLLLNRMILTKERV